MVVQLSIAGCGKTLLSPFFLSNQLNLAYPFLPPPPLPSICLRLSCNPSSFFFLATNVFYK